jgi:CBS domain-containing protein
LPRFYVNCSLEAHVAEAARLMRDRKTDDVLVTDEGKLVGILTDRDIAVRVTGKSLDPGQVSVRDVITTRVLTGEPDWDLDKIAKEMDEHQFRRLPIAESGMLREQIQTNRIGDRMLDAVRVGREKISEAVDRN